MPYDPTQNPGAAALPIDPQAGQPAPIPAGAGVAPAESAAMSAALPIDPQAGQPAPTLAPVQSASPAATTPAPVQSASPAGTTPAPVQGSGPSDALPLPGTPSATPGAGTATTQPQPSDVPFPPPRGAAGPPRVALPTVEADSEPQTVVNKPTIDPRPLAYFQAHDPQFAQMLDNAAQAANISPVRLAAHKWAESRASLDPTMRGGDGEIGPMQVLPSTAHYIDPTGKLDPSNLQDNVMLSAMYIHKLDAQYGKDSPASIAAYNGNPENPQPQAYAKRMLLGGSKLSGSAFATAQGQGRMTPQGLAQAATNGGPNGFMQYMAQTAPRGMGLTDQWRHAEDTLTSAFLARGDVAGAQAAQSLVFQMAHTGANQNLMRAYNALQAGDGVGAAQALAKAHAFFPDDTIGRFRSDGQHVWAERVDEHNPNQRVGSGFNVTAQDIGALLNQTQDPAKFQQMVMAEQKSAAYTRHLDAMSGYYADLPAERQQAAQTRAAATVQSAQARAGATVQAAQTRTGANNQLSTQIDKETANTYNATLMPNVPQQALGRMSEAYKAIRLEGHTPPQAQAIVSGLSDKTLHLLATTDGNFAVAGQDNKPVAYISNAAAQAVLGPAAQLPQGGARPRSPVGGAAGTPYMLGTVSNLAGTQAQQPPAVMQSSAIPVGPSS